MKSVLLGIKIYRVYWYFIGINLVGTNFRGDKLSQRKKSRDSNVSTIV